MTPFPVRIECGTFTDSFAEACRLYGAGDLPCDLWARMPTYRRDGSLRGDATRADPSVIVVEPDAGDPYNGNGFRCATVRPEVPA